uniref:Secreted protein n=1 Tax=Haemonchus contortus TaxID=6289 RepID=A0A7I4YPI1_HAECO
MMIVAHVVTTRSLRPFKVHVFSGALRSLQSNAKTLTQLMLLRNKRNVLTVERNTRIGMSYFWVPSLFSASG